MGNTILKKPAEAGYTLIELLTYTVLASLVLTGALFLFRNATVGYITAVSENLAVEQLHHAHHMLAREIHNVRNKASITTASATQFVFVNSSGQTITVSYAGGQLSRNGTVISKGLSAFQFTYLKWDGAPWTSGATSQIAVVKYQISTISAGRTITSNNAIVLRNTR